MSDKPKMKLNNVDIDIDLKTKTFNSKNISLELLNLHNSSLTFQAMLKDIPETLKNTDRDYGFILTKDKDYG